VPGDRPLSWSRGKAALLALAAVAVTLSAVGVHAVWTRASGPSGSSGSTAYAETCLAVGAAVNVPGGDDAPGTSSFEEAQKQHGRLTIRRSFDPTLPSSFQDSAAADDEQLGVRSFVSWKAPGDDARGVIEGRYDQQITAWAKSVPRTGVFATSIHEPEDNLSAQEFVDYQRHVYPLVKAANPTIHWGPVYNAYWWDPRQPDHYIGDPAAWWPGDQYADFSALDWYGADPEPMTTSPSFRHWYKFMAGTGKPLYITEYGQYVLTAGETSRPRLEEARAAAIRQDAAWIAAHPKLAMWIYWQGLGPRGDWRMHDRASEKAWQQVTDLGCAP
jgi:hypothetical protein